LSIDVLQWNGGISGKASTTEHDAQQCYCQRVLNSVHLGATKGHAEKGWDLLSISRFQPACAIKRVSDGSQRQLWRFLRYILGLPGLFTGPLGGGCLADYSDTWPFLRLLWSCKAFRILQYYLTRSSHAFRLNIIP